MANNGNWIWLGLACNGQWLMSSYLFHHFLSVFFQNRKEAQKVSQTLEILHCAFPNQSQNLYWARRGHFIGSSAYNKLSNLNLLSTFMISLIVIHCFTPLSGNWWFEVSSSLAQVGRKRNCTDPDILKGQESFICRQPGPGGRLKSHNSDLRDSHEYTQE